MTFSLALLLTARLLPAADTNSVSAPPTEPPKLEELMKMTIPIPVVKAASKFEQKTTEAPSSVTIVTMEQVKKYGYRTLADILQSVPGLYVSYDRNYAFLGIRGFNRGDYNSRILLLVDGHRVNNSVKDGAAIGTDFILDVDLIDRVEIIRGPGSSLYGNNAFFGVINVVTRSGDKLNGFEASGEAASFDSYKGRLSYGNKFKNGLEMLLSGSYYDSEGPFNGVARRLDDDGYRSFFGSLGFKELTLQGAFINREKGNPTAQFGTSTNDLRLRTVDERSYVNLKFNHNFPDVAEVTAQVYYDRHDFDIGYPLPSTTFEEMQIGEWWGAELQLTKRLFDRHTFILGAEYRDDFHQERRVFDVLMPSPPSSERERSTRNYGVYLQGDFALRTNLHFSAGGRYDQYGTLDPTANPRLALIYNPVPSSTLKALYGTAFRAPNFFEQVLSGNPNLSPETITTYELVYEQGIGKNLRSSVAGFYNRIDDLITFEAGTLKNLNADVKGVETGLEGLWANGVRGRVSYTYQEAENRATDTLLTDAPRHLGKLNLNVPLVTEKVFAGLELRYSSKRTTFRSSTTSPGTTEPGADAAGFGIVNLTVFSQSLVKGLELSASVYNLLDKRYGDPATPQHFQEIIAQDGRTFRVKLTYRY